MRHLESDEQIALFQWAEYNKGKYPELKLLFHIPNGGKRDKITAIRLKKEGVKAGVPDLCLPVARGEFNGLFIELKAYNNKATELQKEWINDLKHQGYMALVCNGWIEASKEIEEYLKGG